MQVNQKFGIKYKVISLICGIASLLMAVELGLTYLYVYKMHKDTIIQNHLNTAERAAITVNSLLDREIQRVKTNINLLVPSRVITGSNAAYADLSPEQVIARLREMDRRWIIDGNNEIINNYLITESSLKLKQLVKSEPNLAEIFVTDRFGGLVAASNRTSDFWQSDEDWWEKTFNSGAGEVFIGEVEFDESSAAWSIAIAVPIFKEDELIGICKAVMNVEGLFAPVKIIKVEKTGHAVMLNSRGMILYSTGFARIGDQYIAEKDFNRLVSSAEQSGIVAVKDSPKALVALAKINHPVVEKAGLGWWLVLIQDDKEVFRPLDQILFRLALIILGLLSLLIPAGYILGNLFVLPIARLRQATEKIIEGDLDYNFEIKTGDEIQQLAEAFKIMVGNVKIKQESLQAMNIKLESFTKELEEKVAERTNELLQQQTATLNILEDAKDAQELAESYFETAEVIMLVLGSDGRVREINQKGAEILGLPQEEVLNKDWISSFVPERNQEQVRHVFRSIMSGIPQTYEYFENYVVDNKGKEKLIAWHNTLLRDHDNKIIGTLSSGEDITERKLAEETVRRATREWSETFDAMADGVSVHNGDFDIINVNNALCQMLGKDRDSLIGKKCFRIFHNPDSPVDGCPLEQAKATKNKEYVEVFEPTLSRWLSVSVSPVLSEAGEVTRMIHIIRDITERKNAEVALKRAYDELSRAQQQLVQSEKLASLGRFSSGLAHEIKNPLAIMLGAVEFIELRMPKPKEEIKDTLEKIKESIFRADNLIQGLLRFARPSELRAEKVDVSDLINASLALVKYRVVLRNIKVETDFYKDPILLEVDKNQIQQVIFNVILNAYDAMAKGGTVTIKTARRASLGTIENSVACFIEISDTGEGISQDHLSRLFEPFFTTKRNKKGVGLGLAISKTIIENHNGSLIIESERGQGTTVKIVLPVLKEG